MKVKRYKRASRILTFFKYNYKIQAPFKVLVDGTFCLAALENKLNLKEQLPKYLDGEVEIVTTRCVIKELEMLGAAVYGATSICRQLTVAHCPHTPPKTPNDCFLNLARKMSKGGEKYVISTQDPTLTDKLREIPGVPIMYIKYNTMLLDHPSDISKSSANGDSVELEKIKELKKEAFGGEVKKKKRKIKGKNPLSCKKKIVKKVSVQAPTDGTKTANGKRKRRKKTTSTEKPSD